MTDRPLTPDVVAFLHECHESDGGCEHFDKGFGPYARCEDEGDLVPASLIAAAIARYTEGLVEVVARKLHEGGWVEDREGCLSYRGWTDLDTGEAKSERIDWKQCKHNTEHVGLAARLLALDAPEAQT